MVLHYRKRGDVWHCRGSVRIGSPKIPVREFSTGCTSKTEAEAVGALRSPESAMRGSVTPGGATKRPGLDALLKDAARRECSAGRSLSDLIGLLGELRSHDIDLYLHQPALDTSTPSGRMLFGMLGVFRSSSGR